MATDISRIAVNTGGGDAPGLNAVIQAVTFAASRMGWEVCGIREGYSGLLDPQNYPDGGLVRLTPASVRNISHRGGTILWIGGTSCLIRGEESGSDRRAPPCVPLLGFG